MSNIIVSKANGTVSVKVEGDADVEVIVIDDGSDDVYIEGTVGNVAIKASGITVTAKSAQVSNINIAGEGVTLIVDEGSIAEFLAVSGQAADTTVEVSGIVSTIETQAPKTSIIGSGSVGVAQVQAGADFLPVAEKWKSHSGRCGKHIHINRAGCGQTHQRDCIIQWKE